MRPTVDKVKPLLEAYLASPGNSVGGSLHIYTDDDNIDDSHIDYCIGHAESIGDADGVELGRLILQMTKTQRRKLRNVVRRKYG